MGQRLFYCLEGVKNVNKTEAKLQYDICTENRNGLPVIIVAAGSSTRMNGKNKLFLELNGIPVIAKTLLAFENCEKIKNIILVTRDEDILSMQLVAEKYMITKLSDIVCGGENRQKSVLNGFARLDENDKNVLIHDGARPLVSERIICDVADALEKYSAVTCAVRLKDTVKETDEKGMVIKTLDRKSLVAVQTPQGVNACEYLKAAENADLSLFTDDTSVMEAAGYEVFTVEGDYKNIKITTPEDIFAAEAMREADGLCE